MECVVEGKNGALVLDTVTLLRLLAKWLEIEEEEEDIRLSQA